MMNLSNAGMRLNSALVTGRVASVTRAALAVVGLFAIFVVAVPAPREMLLRHASAERGYPVVPGVSVFGSVAGAIQGDGEPTYLELEQRAVADFIARKYRVADQAAVGFVTTAYRAGKDLRVDPLLILAVAAIESRYNPVAESFLGARGLMQIIPKYHPEKLREHGGEEALLDPRVNIMVGAKILREYRRRFGETETALQVYGGAFDEPTLQYANKVLAERARLAQTVQRLRAEDS